MNDKKNVLVLSFEPFSKEGTNGKTIWSLFSGEIDSYNLSQIYIKGGTPNVDAKCRYLFIDEKNITHPFKSKKSICEEVISSEKICSNANGQDQKIKKTSFKMLIRNFLWRIHYWKFKYVFQWIELEKPDWVVLQDNDLPFFCFLASEIQKRYNCKVLFYTTENYSLKKADYMSKTLISNRLTFSIFRNKLFKAHKRLFKTTNKEIFLTDSLMKEYSNSYELNDPCVLYPSSECPKLTPKKEEADFVVSYCGGLGVGRFDTLLDFIRVSSTSDSIKIIVASKLDSQLADTISSFKNVKYVGFVPYDEVLRLYENSDLLLHIESFKESIKNDCVHAFSGKIADCISSQRPFLYYGPNGNAISDFLAKYDCGFQANSEEELKTFIAKVALDRKSLLLKKENAEMVSTNLFSKNKNSSFIKEIIFSL